MRTRPRMRKLPFFRRQLPAVKAAEPVAICDTMDGLAEGICDDSAEDQSLVCLDLAPSTAWRCHGRSPRRVAFLSTASGGTDRQECTERAAAAQAGSAAGGRSVSRRQSDALRIDVCRRWAQALDAPRGVCDWALRSTEHVYRSGSCADCDRIVWLPERHHAEQVVLAAATWGATAITRPGARRHPSVIPGLRAAPGGAAARPTPAAAPRRTSRPSDSRWLPTGRCSPR